MERASDDLVYQVRESLAITESNFKVYVLDAYSSNEEAMSGFMWAVWIDVADLGSDKATTLRRESGEAASKVTPNQSSC